MSEENANELSRYYKEALSLLRERLNVPQERALAIVDEIVEYYLRLPHCKIVNPRRVLLRAAREWVVKGKPVDPHRVEENRWNLQQAEELRLDVEREELWSVEMEMDEVQNAKEQGRG